MVIVDARRVGMPVPTWVLLVLAVQLVVLGACAWHAVRLVTRPLAQLAAAADDLGPDLKARELAEDGPTEVAHAARAFNAMQRRIAGYMAERVEILAAISHDLQTPITRMRLRTDLMDNEKDQAKFRQDLDAMNAAGAGGRELCAHAPRHRGASLSRRCRRAARKHGRRLRGRGPAGAPGGADRKADRDATECAAPHPREPCRQRVEVRSDVRVRVQADADRLVVAVVDNGPGIPDDQLEAVLKPFYRVENSRNRSTGGTGLGLAIAHQLAVAMGAELKLRNRAEGGLEARLILATNLQLTCCDIMLILIIAYVGGVLTILSPCILPVLPFVFARADRPFRSHGLPLLAGMAVSFAAIATLAAVGGGWVVAAQRVRPIRGHRAAGGVRHHAACFRAWPTA